MKQPRMNIVMIFVVAAFLSGSPPSAEAKIQCKYVTRLTKSGTYNCGTWSIRCEKTQDGSPKVAVGSVTPQYCDADSAELSALPYDPEAIEIVDAAKEFVPSQSDDYATVCSRRGGTSFVTTASRCDELTTSDLGFNTDSLMWPSIEMTQAGGI